MNKPDDEFNTSAAGSLLALGLSAVNSFVGAKTKKDMLAVGQTLDSALGRLSVVEAATTALAGPSGGYRSDESTGRNKVCCGR